MTKTPTQEPVKTKKRRSRANEAEKKLVASAMPVVAMDRGTGAGILEDGSLVDMLLIRAKDLNAISEDDATFDAVMTDKLFRIYPGDLKIVSINFPADTRPQQEYLHYKYRQTSNPLFRRLIGQEIDKAVWINKNRTEKEYLLLFFSADAEKHKESLRTIFGALSRGATPLVSVLPPEKKREIYRRLYNKVFAI